MVTYDIKLSNDNFVVRLNDDGSSRFVKRVTAQVVPQPSDIIRIHANDENDQTTPSHMQNADDYIVVRVIHDIYPNGNHITVIVKKHDGLICL